jgi:hypothetical protein
MKYSLDLVDHARANVWLGELPPAEFTGATLVAKLLKPRTLIPATRRMAAVELAIPHGAKTSYALLGGELAAADADGLDVIVSLSDASTPFQASLVAKIDEVSTGLLDEYADAVIRGVAAVAERAGAPTRSALQFRCAAHGRIGSSQAAFERVSGLVLQLLLLPDGASDRHIRALFEAGG